jgi:hypothetical protein
MGRDLTERDKLCIRRRLVVRYIATRKRAIAKLETELAALDKALAKAGGPPKRYTFIIPMRAKAGGIQRPLLSLLRERGSITAPELAAVMLLRFGLPTNNRKIKYAMDQRCFRALERCGRRGMVRQDGKRGRAALWRLA